MLTVLGVGWCDYYLFNTVHRLAKHLLLFDATDWVTAIIKKVPLQQFLNFCA